MKIGLFSWDKMRVVESVQSILLEDLRWNWTDDDEDDDNDEDVDEDILWCIACGDVWIIR